MLPSFCSQAYVKTNVLIQPGSSGGPALDRNGRVVGIQSKSYSPEKWPGNYIRPVELALGLLDEALLAVGVRWPSLAPNPARQSPI
jgi:S1-C subfamily serine protease